MSVKAFVVVLESNVSEERSDDVAKLLGLIRGVASVRPVPSRGMDDMIAREQARRELEKGIMDVLWPPKEGSE